MIVVNCAVILLAAICQAECVNLMFHDEGPKDGYRVLKVNADLKCPEQPCNLPMKQDTKITVAFESRSVPAYNTTSIVYLDMNAQKPIDVKPKNCPAEVCPIRVPESKTYPITVNPNFYAEPMALRLHWELRNEKKDVLFHIYIPFIIFDPTKDELNDFTALRANVTRHWRKSHGEVHSATQIHP